MNPGRVLPPLFPMKILESLQDGSDRVFHRVEWEGRTAILLRDENPDSLRKYVEIDEMLRPYSPEIYRFDGKSILMEDLGNESLYEWMRKGRPAEIYFQVLDALREIQRIDCRGLPDFGRDALVGEVEYFLRWNPHMSRLKDFLMDNALLLSAMEERAFMHRDFQSRNIFIKGGRIRLIDFQSAHCGHPYYDLASLLWDPYVNLQRDFRRELAEYYGADIHLLKRFAIQRLAQATAAYRKLSRRKPFFERFIPISTNTLMELIDEVNSN